MRKSLLKSAAPTLVLTAAFGLSACGTTPGDRMLSGGLLGAGAGAAIGSVAGTVGSGALIGGVAGAALGALTSPRDVYLGEPPWSHHYYHSAHYYSHHHYHYYSRAAANGCVTTYTEERRVTSCPRQ